MPIVSIIVPVYNTKEYLQKCFDSLKTQELYDVEFIIIDDGSTDGSDLICDEFAQKDSRCIVLHKKNEGLSIARNEGLLRASGKYIMFVDSDDWVERDFCSASVDVAERTGADIVVFQYYIHAKRRVMNRSFPKTGFRSKEEILAQLWNYVWAAAWNKLYRREMFCEFEYPTGRLFEDTAVTHHIIYKAQNIYLLEKTLYHYRSYRPGSITNCRSKFSTDEYFYWNFKRIDDLKRWGYDSKTEEYKYSFSYLVNKGENEFFSRRCKEYLIKNKNEARTLLPWKMKLFFDLYIFSPRFFDIVCRLTGKRVY